MGQFLAYTFYSGICLLLLYLLFRLFISGEKQIALNCGLMIACYIVAFTWWPLCRLLTPSNDSVVLAPPVSLLVFQEVRVVEDVRNTERVLWPIFLIAIYLSGAFVVLIRTMISLFRLSVFLRRGRKIRKEGYTLVVIPGEKVSPFSFGKYVVVGEGDVSTIENMVIAHEEAHIRFRHYLDLILAQTVCIVLWYNPAAWLMRDEMSLLHEYQADAAVLNVGMDARSYQMLLVRKTLGNRFHTLANNLNHTKLKNRIAMMQKEKSGVLRRTRVATLALAPLLAFAVVHIPAVAAGLNSVRNASYGFAGISDEVSVAGVLVSEDTPAQENFSRSLVKVADADKAIPMKKKGEIRQQSAQCEVEQTENAVAEAPILLGTIKKSDGAKFTDTKGAHYPGGTKALMEYMALNLRYPVKAQQQGITGRPVVGFTIQPDGKISNVRIVEKASPELETEALRLVKAMPDWTPAISGSRAVAADYFLPVSFELSPSKQTPDDATLDEIKVVGYGAVKRSDAEIAADPTLGDSRVISNVHTPDKVYVSVEVETSPAVFVDGVRYEKSIDTIDKDKIDAIYVAKDTPDFPEGRIDIVLKK